MPTYEILEKCGLENGAQNPHFRELIEKKLSKLNGNFYQAYFQTYLEVIKNSGKKLIDENISFGADNLIYNDGVVEFLTMIKENNGKNYLLSAGMKTYLTKTKVASLFDQIFATTFLYNDNREIIGIDYLMSDKKKVDAIKKIIQEDKRNKNDCTDIIYIGDGLTDYYAMEYVKNNGGKVIFVYNDDKNEEVITIIKNKNIVDLFTKADYSVNSELNNYIKTLLLEPCKK